MVMNEDRVMMKDGRMVIVRNAKLLPMDLDLTMSDGTKVTTKGSVMRPDGTVHQMQEGESINMADEISNIDDSIYVNDTKDMDDMSRMVD